MHAVHERPVSEVLKIAKKIYDNVLLYLNREG
jgi:hypothetical protein